MKLGVVNNQNAALLKSNVDFSDGPLFAHFTVFLIHTTYIYKFVRGCSNAYFTNVFVFPGSNPGLMHFYNTKFYQTSFTNPKLLHQMKGHNAFCLVWQGHYFIKCTYGAYFRKVLDDRNSPFSLR